MKCRISCLALLSVSLIQSTASCFAAFEIWERHYNVETATDSDAIKLATDNQDNLVIVGNTTTGRTGSDITLIKYSNSGAALWTNRFDGGSSSDTASAVVTDGFGRIYATGTSDSALIVLAYAPEGTPLWTNRYKEFQAAWGNAISVDSVGRVYVAGRSRISGTNDDYVILAYSQAGQPLWTNRYDGTGSGIDNCTLLTVGLNDTICVSGSSETTGAFRAATIAFSSNGSGLWTNTLTGFTPESVATDQTGNVFVTGSQQGSNGNDFFTIAYSGTGTVLWTNRYSRPGKGTGRATAVATDTDGDVYVSGFSQSGSGGLDYVLLKYSNNGNPVWTNRFAPSGINSTWPASVVVDGQKNIYVTGVAFLLACSSTGSMLWTNSFAGPGSSMNQPRNVAMGAAGKVYVTGTSLGSEYGYCTIAYSTSGLSLWTNLYTATGIRSSLAQAVALGKDGTVYVTGSGPGARNQIAATTIAYSGSGSGLWTNIFEQCQPAAVFAADDGRVFVAGSSYASGAYGFVTFGYSNTGALLWTNVYRGPGTRDFLIAAALANNGNLYITGESANGADLEIATIAYSSIGTPLWTNRYHGPAGSDAPLAIACDNDSNVFIAAGSEQGGTLGDYLTIAYSSTGVPLWTNIYHGPGNSGDSPQAIAIGTNQNVYVTGFVFGTNGLYDYATLAYSNSGTPLWTNYFDGSQHDQANAIAVGQNGNVYVTGNSGGDAGYEFATVAYSVNGAPLWTNRYACSGNPSDVPVAIATDALGNVYVAGNSAGIGTGSDFAILAYSSSGTPLWTNRYNGPANGYDAIPSGSRALAASPDGEVFVVGFSDVDNSQDILTECTVVKYAAIPSIRLTRPRLASNTTFQFTISAPTNISYTLETSTNLVNWTILTNFSNLREESVDFSDGFDSSRRSRFYRTVWSH